MSGSPERAMREMRSAQNFSHYYRPMHKTVQKEIRPVTVISVLSNRTTIILPPREGRTSVLSYKASHYSARGVPGRYDYVVSLQ
ncbi:hypothetical protein AVEN_233054-1 [Araneus ventricosus]|uniref:Uncharacterized protein n=1 Tax=Araneus ventricosus TaxID=182803 RepID=A0A4Y2UT90_ARAVE|nr:hypothetical protein AVEN_233054-1 [Araneus ventricosus]